MRADVAAIVPVAGMGRRFGGRMSKPLAPVDGRPLLAHTLQVLQASPAVRWIVPVIREADRRAIRALLVRYKISKALDPCLGGPTRAESVARGFAAVPGRPPYVLVHDGARPCLSQTLIQQVVRAARRHGAAACGLPASVTVKAVDEAREVRVTLDRSHLWFVQTPQVFRRDWFAQSLQAANGHLGQFTDDAALLEGAGFPVRMVPGDSRNLKVTTRADLLVAEALLRDQRGASAGRGTVRQGR